MPVKRIAILSVHTSPFAHMGGAKIGGMNVYIRELAHEMAKRGIEIDIFTRRYADDLPDIEYYFGDRVRLIHINAGPSQIIAPLEGYPYVQQFASGVVKFTTRYAARYEVIYSHYWLSGLVAKTLRDIWGVPFVQMFHTLGHMKNRVASKIPPMPDIRVVKETEVVQQADRIIASTLAEQMQLIWLYRADRKKIEVVPPGVDTSRFYPKTNIDLSLIPQEFAGRNLLLYVGRIEHLKAIDTGLEALAIIRNHHPQVYSSLAFGVIGGDLIDTANSEMIRLQSLVRELNLEESVKFLGAKDHTMLPDYYAAATAILMTSEYESFGMAALEAMATGTPVIASEVGGLAFLVQDGHTGFLVPVRDSHTLADRIMDLMSDPDRYMQFRKNSVVLARSYDWATVLDRVINVLERVNTKTASIIN